MTRRDPFSLLKSLKSLQFATKENNDDNEILFFNNEEGTGESFGYEGHAEDANEDNGDYMKRHDDNNNNGNISGHVNRIGWSELERERLERAVSAIQQKLYQRNQSDLEHYKSKFENDENLNNSLDNHNSYNSLYSHKSYNSHNSHNSYNSYNGDGQIDNQKIPLLPPNSYTKHKQQLHLTSSSTSTQTDDFNVDGSYDDYEIKKILNERSIAEEAYKDLKSQNSDLMQEIKMMGEGTVQMSESIQRLSSEVEHQRLLYEKEKTLSFKLEDTVKEFNNHIEKLSLDYYRLKDMYDQVVRENQLLKEEKRLFGTNQLMMDNHENVKQETIYDVINSTPDVSKTTITTSKSSSDMVEEPSVDLDDENLSVQSIDKEFLKLSQQKLELEAEYSRLPGSFTPLSPRYKSRHQVNQRKEIIETTLDSIEQRRQKLNLLRRYLI